MSDSGAPASLRWTARAAVVPEELYGDTTISDRAIRLWCYMHRYPGGTPQDVVEQGALDLDCSRREADQALTELLNAGWFK